MAIIDNSLIVLAIILFFGLIGPEFFKKLRLPFVTSLILVGGLLGPHALNMVQSTEAIEFFGLLGSTFIMLLAGLEVKWEYFKNIQKEVLTIILLNTTIPFITGLVLIRILGYSWATSWLVGIIFLSSSVAIVASSIKQSHLQNSNIGKIIITIVAIEDTIGVLLFTLFTQAINPSTIFPPLIYLGIILSLIMLLRMFLPEISTYYFKKFKTDDEYESQLRLVVALLLFVLTFFSWFGVHPIVGAFLVGVLISDVIKSEALQHKLHTLGYGLFVPVFFFVIGMQMDFSLLTTPGVNEFLVISIVLGLILSKFFSGYFAAKSQNFTVKESTIFGVSSTAKLTTTLSATYAALSLNLLDSTLATSLIILSIVTTMLAPILLNVLSKKWRSHNA
ncbi:MAG: cation:proton antiporter [archaeon]